MYQDKRQDPSARPLPQASRAVSTAIRSVPARTRCLSRRPAAAPAFVTER